jgi:capsular exopolysaccharide synthesis family protein
VFTSAGPGEGKTTTVCNLGIALAETNRRVLLIDADMRKPRLHDVFNLPNTWGLSDLLREKAPIDTLPREALARETGIPGLFVLTSGPATVSISNLLYSSRTAELLHRFRKEYYTVLIDTPPMMQLADARILGRLADAAILVLGCGRTTRDAAKAAKQRLSADGIQVLGSILNRWDPKSASSYGVYGYYDGYYAKRQG